MTRIQIELAKDKLAQYEELMAKCGIRTKKDLINNALTLLEWAVREREKGNLIASLDEDKGRYKELCLPILSNIQQKAVAEPFHVESHKSEREMVH